jgi:superfamily I DNA and/or RNA helicase
MRQLCVHSIHACTLILEVHIHSLSVLQLRDYHNSIEVNTVDLFQGREANIVIYSCVRAAGSKGIGFLSDVRRTNVALTRGKHFLEDVGGNPEPLDIWTPL